MKTTLLFLSVFLTSSVAFTQESSYNVTTYAGGKSVNIRKDVKRYIAVSDDRIVVRSVGSPQTYWKWFDTYSIKYSDGCTLYWTTDKDSKRTVLFKLCEDEVTPFIKKVNYHNGNSTKVIYYYYDD